jgi:hypothetical protein
MTGRHPCPLPCNMSCPPIRYDAESTEVHPSEFFASIRNALIPEIKRTAKNGGELLVYVFNYCSAPIVVQLEHWKLTPDQTILRQASTGKRLIPNTAATILTDRMTPGDDYWVLAKCRAGENNYVLANSDCTQRDKRACFLGIGLPGLLANVSNEMYPAFELYDDKTTLSLYTSSGTKNKIRIPLEWAYSMSCNTFWGNGAPCIE